MGFVYEGLTMFLSRRRRGVSAWHCVCATHQYKDARAVGVRACAGLSPNCDAARLRGPAVMKTSLWREAQRRGNPWRLDCHATLAMTMLQNNSIRRINLLASSRFPITQRARPSAHRACRSRPGGFPAGCSSRTDRTGQLALSAVDPQSAKPGRRRRLR